MHRLSKEIFAEASQFERMKILEIVFSRILYSRNEKSTATKGDIAHERKILKILKNLPWHLQIRQNQLNSRLLLE